MALKKNLVVKFGSNIPFENHVNSLCKKPSQVINSLKFASY